MKRKNTTRNALVTSIIAMLLCVSMLVGTTFAWFTDEVVSGTNVIAAGNLDVELYNSLVIDENKKVNTATKLFDEITLWEPGVVAFENLTVANLGTLALKYQLSINFTDATTNANGDTLAKILKVGFVEGGIKSTTREGALTEVTAWQPLESFVQPGDLAVGENDVYGIVIYWQPSDIDNEFNMNNENQGKVMSINLGVKLFATQLEAEEDSFGPDYDEDAWHNAMIVTSEADFNAAIANGETALILANDIALTESIVIPEGATVALNLNGKTLEATNDVAIRANGNLTLTGEGTIKGNAGQYVVRAQAGSTITVNEGIVVEGGFGAIAVPGGTLIVNGGDFSNVEVNASHYVVAVWNNGEVIINGGTFTFAEDQYASANGAPVIGAWGGGSVEINGGTFDASSGSALCYNSASVVVKGGTFMNAAAKTYGGTVSNKVASGYQVVDNGDGTFTVLAGKVAVTNTDELVAAIKNGETEIALAPGNYVMPTSFNGSGVSLQYKTLKLVGTRNAVIETSHVDERDQYVTGANLAFEGVTLNFGTANYMGFANCASLTYTDCAINGLQFCYGTGTYSFVDCDLNSNGAEHSVWTWGGQNVSFTGCDFTYADRAVNCYGQGVTTNASFTDCTFTKVAGKDTTGAIETNSSALTALNLTINNCTVNEGDLWWVSTWDGKGGANTTVTLDGKTTVATAAQLTAVVAKGVTDINLMDGEYDVYGCGGKTLTINGSEKAVIKLYNDGEDGCDYAFGGNGTGVGDVTFNGVTIDTTSNTGNYKGFAYMKGTFNDCNFVGAYSLNNANDFVFNRCTFDFKNGYFWTWGANSVTFNACVFNGNSKAILAHGYASTVITIKDCKFNATEQGFTGAGDNTAAVEIDPAGSNTYTIIFEGENTITGSYAGWTRVKDGSTGHTITGLN